MSDDIKGVFVRLPLSDEQRMTANEAPYKKDRKGSALEASILSIGTLVTGKNLDCAVIIEQDDKRYMPEVVSYQPHLVKPKQLLNLVRQSDAQAQIAALEAEVVRLREALESLENANNNLCFMRSNDTYQSMMRDGCGDLLAKLDDARRAAREALKGGAA